MKMTFIDSLGLLHPRKTLFFLVPKKLFLGTGIPRDRAIKRFGDSLGMGPAKILGIFGVYPRIPPFFGAGDGDRAFKDFGDALGTWKPQKLGIFWRKIPENL